MERLTRVMKINNTKLVVYTKGKYEDTTAAEMEYKDVRNVMRRLSEYEDTSLDPDKIQELKDRDTAKAPEPAPLGMEGMVCPTCGCKALPWAKFCDECGQKFVED